MGSAGAPDSFSCGSPSPFTEEETTAISALLHRGTSLEHEGYLMEALMLYDEMLQEWPELSDVFFNRGNVLMKMGRLEEAVQSFHNAIKFDPKVLN